MEAPATGHHLAMVIGMLLGMEAGMILGEAVLGLAPWVAAYGVWRRRPWGWTSSFVVGAALIVWLATQIRIIGYHPDPPLQLTYGLLACAIAVLAVLRGRERGVG